MSLADQIRDFVYRNYIRPAKEAGERTLLVRAGDIHRDMGLRNRLPAVCSAIGSRRFREESSLKLIGRSGPPKGSSTEFRFRLSDAPQPGMATGTEAKSSHAAMSRAHEGPAGKTISSSTIFLVSCVGKKQATEAPARELYTSDWFVKARRYVEATGCPWFILSAEYGLVRPAQKLRPYDKTLNRMTACQRKEWGSKVIEQMKRLLPPGEAIVVLAGKRYREPLQDFLERRFQTVSVPLEGLRIGEQLHWFNERAASERPDGDEPLDENHPAHCLPTLAREHHEVARSFEGFFDRAHFVARFGELFPDRTEGSIIPSDYCFNRENKGNRDHPRFLWWDGSKSYVFVGLDGAPRDFRITSPAFDGGSATRPVSDQPYEAIDELSTDIDRARDLARRLDYAFSPDGTGIFGKHAMPEDLLPPGVQESSRQHLLYMTLVVSADYMRDADTLWAASRAAYADPDTRFLFDPEAVCSAGPERTSHALRRTGIALRPTRDARAWFVICETLHTKWRGNPREFLDDCGWHAPTILARLHSDNHAGQLSSGPDFPLLRGPKIGPLWIRILRDNIGLELAGLDDVAIPVDVHVLRATLCAGAITGRYAGGQPKLFERVRQVWREAVRGLTRHDGKPMVALDVDEALWTLSREGCSKRGNGHLGPCAPGCPARPGCVTGQIRIVGPRCMVETRPA